MPQMNPSEIASFLPLLKGPQLSILVAFLLSDRNVAYGTNDLAPMIGYSRTTTSQAMQTLALRGLTQNLARFNGWMLTLNAKQLFLMEQFEDQNLTLGNSSSSSTYIYEEDRDLNLEKKEETTTTTQASSEDQILILPLDDSYIAEIVQYFQQNGITRKSYQPALLTALNAGWSTQHIHTAFRLWLHFTEDPKHNINAPPFYIIARIQELDPPPINKDTPCLFCDSPYAQHLHRGPICPECGGCSTCCTCNQEEN